MENDEQDEGIDAPEDDFGDFELAENEHDAVIIRQQQQQQQPPPPPQPTQPPGANAAAPSWVYPDVVHIHPIDYSMLRSTSHSIAAAAGSAAALSSSSLSQLPLRVAAAPAVINENSSSNNAEISARNNLPRLPNLLNPPDVSLLSSVSTIATGNHQTSTLDICNSTANSTISVGAGASGASSSSNGLSGPILLSSPASTSASSHSPSHAPASSSSSSSSAAASSTSSSSLILSSNNKIRNGGVGGAGGKIHENHHHESSAQSAQSRGHSGSTSSVSSVVAAKLRVSNLEREIRTLEMQKTLMHQQLRMKDEQIDGLRKTLSAAAAASSCAASTSSGALEQTLVTRINDCFANVAANMENSISRLENRIKKLEISGNRSRNVSTMPPVMVNGQMSETNDSNGDHENIASNHIDGLIAQAFEEIQRKTSDRNRQEMCTLFRNILRSAIREIDSFASPNNDNDNDSREDHSKSKITDQDESQPLTKR